MESREARPHVVFFGKGALVPPESIAAKLQIFQRHLKTTIVAVNSTAPRWSDVDARIVQLPAKPKLLASILFYTLGAALATLIARRLRGSVVCQSPFEAVGVLCVRRFFTASARPPVLVEVHGDWRAAPALYGRARSRAASVLAARLGDWAIRQSDHVRVVSQAMERLVRSAGYEGAVDQYAAYSDFEHFLARPPVRIEGDPGVLYVGALEYAKGVDLLINAAARLDQRNVSARFILLGDGSLSQKLREEVQARGLEDVVHLAGSRTRSEVATLMDSSWCVVVPSRSEGLSRVTMEAMARGRPVVASAVGGLPELVEHGRTGFLVPPEDSVSLASALVRLLADKDLVRAMGSAGRERIECRNPADEFEAGVRRLARWAHARGREGS